MTHLFSWRKSNGHFNYQIRIISGNLQKKDCTLDLHLSVLKYEGKSIELTRNEFRILYYFFMNEDKIISKEELLEKLWNDKYYLDETYCLLI